MSDAPRSRKERSAETSPFLNEARNVLRLKHMSRRTEASYIFYILDYIRFHGKRHPRETGAREVRTYLSHLAHLAAKGKEAVSAKNVDSTALLFVEIENIQPA
jgi:hypothetical protein